MVRLEKHGVSAVRFIFTDSDHYLYKDGVVDVPVNSLSLVIDESEMVTFKKASTGDPFISFRLDKSNFSSRDELLTFYKENMVGAGGISEEEVQQMIDAATSGIPSSEVIEQLRRDVNAVSGEVDTKQDILTAGENITISGNVISAEAGNNIIELTQAEYDALTEKDPDALYIITDAQEINMNNYYTKTEVDASIATKADTSALTVVNNSLTAHTANTEVHVTQAEKNTWNGKLDASAYTPTDLSQYWTSGQTQQAINAATSGIPSSEVIEQLRTDVNTISGATENLNDRIDDVWSVIDEKEEVIASALTQLNQDVAEIDAKEEVIASALTEVRQDVENKQDALTAGSGIEISGNVISATGGALFVDFDDLMENMNDEKWDELVDAIQNNKPIFYVYDYSEGDIADAGQSPVDGYVYINEGEESTEIGLKKLYGGGYRDLIITKNGSEDYEVTDDYYDYQPLLQAGSGISIDENNVISVTGGSSVTVDSAITSASTNAVENRAIYDKVTMEVESDTIEYDSEPVTATTSGSRYYKVEFNDPGQVVTFTVAGLPDTIKLDSNTGQLTYTSGGALPEGLVTDTRYQSEYGVVHEVAFNSDYNVTSAVVTIGADIIYVGHKGTETVWVKGVVADLASAVTAVSNDLNTLSGAVIDNEYTVSQAINSLNNRVTAVESGGTGGGITSGEVQTMINDSLDIYWTSAQTQTAIDAAGGYLIDLDTIMQRGLTDAEWDGTIEAVTNERPVYIKAEGYWCALQSYYLNGNEMKLLAASDNFASIYTVTKLGSNQYSLSNANKQYVSQAEKDAWNAKQDALSAGTGIAISGNVISATGGGGVTVDPTLNSGSTNPVANSAITNAINTVSGAIPSTYISSATVDSDQGYLRFFRFSTPSNYNYLLLNNATINNRGILSNGWGGFNTNFSLVETSAITTSITSASTNDEVAGAKAVYDAIQAGGGGGVTVDPTLDSGSTNPVANSAITAAIDGKQDALSAGTGISISNNVISTSGVVMSQTVTQLVKLTQAAYDALATKDSSTLYIISD